MNSIERFTGRVQTYNRFRLRYPTTVVLDRLNRWCNLQPHWLIADVGAGTGMLSEVFLSNGNPVIAIEPNEEMRAACNELLTQWPQLELRDGTAETTGLLNNSVDIVAAGRAFHWFDVPRALTEFRRILHPTGWLVLVSLGRAKDDTPQYRDFEALLTSASTDYTHVRAGYRVHDNLDDVFLADRHSEQIPSEQQLPWEAFLGQTMSLSVVPQPDDPRFPTFTNQLRDHFQTYAVDNLITIPTTCWIDVGRLSTQ